MQQMIRIVFICCFAILFCKNAQSFGAEKSISPLTRSSIAASRCIQFADLWKNAETGNPAPEYFYQCAIRFKCYLASCGGVI